MLEVAPSQAAVGSRLFPSLVAAGLLLVGVALLLEAFSLATSHTKAGSSSIGQWWAREQV